MASVDELACTYSALILADDDVPITAEKLNTILKAANVTVESIWPTLFARALSACNIKDLINNIGSAAAAPAAAAGTGAAPAEEAKKEDKKEEEKKKEETDSEDEDMGFGLFD